MSFELTDLAEPERFRRRLVAAFGRPPRGRVLLAIAVGGAVRYVCVDAHGASSCREPPVHPGCATKLLTATLARRVAAAGACGLDDDVGAVLGAPARRGALSGVTLRHLLEHTHGLDGSRLVRPPVRGDGFIDAHRLGAAAAARPALARPGCLYSYGEAGAWLAAAVLERCTGMRYERLLREHLLAPLGIEMRREVAASLPRTLCPAAGGPLALSLAGLLEVVRHAAFDAGGPFGVQADYAAAAQPLPGFSVLERGVLMGWKHYGDDCFGHNSTWPGAEALVRVRTGRRLALVLASSDPPALAVAARLLGDLLPELRRLRVPRPLDDPRTTHAEQARHAGTYRTAAERLCIVAAGRGGLELRADLAEASRRAPRRLVRARLRPAEQGVLLTEPPLRRLPFVQLVEPPGHDRTYLWDGSRLWPKDAHAER